MATKLGNKHLCFHCGVKFYDFGRSEILCPSCGADQKSGKPPEEDPEVEAAEADAAADADLEEMDEELDGDAEDLDGDEDEEEDFEDGDLEELGEMGDDDLDGDDEYEDDEVDDY